MMQSIFTLCGGVFVACMRYAEAFSLRVCAMRRRFLCVYAPCGGVFRCIYTRGAVLLCIFINIGAFLENIGSL